MDFNQIDVVSNELQKKAHYIAGLSHQHNERSKALHCLDNDELLGIYHLVQSHVPGLHLKTAAGRAQQTRNDQKPALENPTAKNPLLPPALNVPCATDTQIQQMLQHLQEMPSEWTIVQITPQFNPLRNLNLNKKCFFTSPLHLCIFHCGNSYRPPIEIRVPVPRNTVTGTDINLVDEMHAIIAANRQLLVEWKGRKYFQDRTEKTTYQTARRTIDERMKKLISDVQNLWLGYWRCMLAGRYENTNLEERIKCKIDDFHISQKLKPIGRRSELLLHNLIKCSSQLNLREHYRLLETIYTNDTVIKNCYKFITQLIEDLRLTHERRLPVILILDDSLDCFPWEMLDVLRLQPVCRAPSLHIVYALYYAHRATIVGGYKCIQRPSNGAYILNPDGNLAAMERRMGDFLRYWTPKWRSLIGAKPTEDVFRQMLTEAEIFAYIGHGNGTSFIALDKLQRCQMQAVALLFGCSSTTLLEIGPQVEPYATHQMYLIANSPCCVGMLWEVTDTDTDNLTSEFIGRWVPSEAPLHWCQLDKHHWTNGADANLKKTLATYKSNELATGTGINNDTSNSTEPDLLRALSLAKIHTKLVFYVNSVACVARGIPVKIVQDP